MIPPVYSDGTGRGYLSFYFQMFTTFLLRDVNKLMIKSKRNNSVLNSGINVVPRI